MIKTSHLVENVHSISWAQSTDSFWVQSPRAPIDCWVKFNHSKQEVPFTASPEDTEQHGRLLYNRLISGEFGKIHPYGSFSYTSSWRNSPRETSLSPETISIFAQAMDEANTENENGTARGIVLVWSALLEVCLAEVLRSKHDDQSVARTIGQKVSQLNSAITLDSELLADLTAITEIRNKAAHELYFTSFSHLRELERAYEGYERLYSGFAAETFHEVEDLLFVARFVFAPACRNSIERVYRLLSE
jgi:hypothetical protein